MIWTEEFVQSWEAGLGKAAPSALDKCSDVKNDYKELFLCREQLGRALSVETVYWNNVLGYLPVWELCFSKTILLSSFVAVD